MLEFNNISIILKKNDRPLIKDFNFTLQQGDKIAIIGEEGNGKSTLLKLVIDKKEVESYANVSGQINTSNLKIGYLEQVLNSNWNDTPVMEYFLKDSYKDEINYDKYSELNSVYELFSKFKIDYSLLDDNQLIKTLSGGEKVKIQLIKILSENPDLLLLDEPTNDLDIPTLEWLETFIINSSTPILYVSHDETLLERTANGIIHLEQIKKKTQSRYTIEHIGYKEYVEKRFGLLERQEQIAKKQRSDYNKQMEGFRQVYQKVEHQQNTITRADPHGAALLKKKMKSLKSQEKRYEREKDSFLDTPDVEESINFKFDTEIEVPSGKTILDFELDKLIIGNKELSSNIYLNVKGPEHLVIIGQNGIGKTTLLKNIYEDLKDRKDIKVGYMSQNYEDLLNLTKNAVDFLCTSSSKEDLTKARTYLASLKFTSEETLNEMSLLSGGQKAKILLLKLVLDKCNVLLLDEPTRNLSPLSNPVIRNMLEEYPGTIISISHDRKYIEEVCDKVLELTPNGLVENQTYLKNDINYKSR